MRQERFPPAAILAMHSRQRRQHQAEFAGDEVDDGQDADERQPEKRRDCIAQLAYGRLCLGFALNYVTTLIRLRNDCGNWGCALPYLLTRGQAPSTNAAPEGKHVLQTRSTERRTKFSKSLNFFWSAISPIGDGADIGSSTPATQRVSETQATTSRLSA